MGESYREAKSQIAEGHPHHRTRGDDTFESFTVFLFNYFVVSILVLPLLPWLLYMHGFLPTYNSGPTNERKYTLFVFLRPA